MAECFLYGNGGGDGCKIKFDNYLPLSGEVSYGLFPDLSIARSSVAACTIEGKSLFGGGDRLPNVDVYEGSGVHTQFPDLIEPSGAVNGIAFDNKAIFNTVTKTNVYDKNGVQSTFPDLPIQNSGQTPVIADTLLIFAGGYRNVEVYAYGIDGVQTVLPNLTTARAYYGAASARSKAVLAGGSNNNISEISTVEVYDSNGVKSAFPDITARSYISSSSTGKAVFAGGQYTIKLSESRSTTGQYSIVEVFDESGVRYSYPNLFTARHSIGGTNVNELAVFGGGGYVQNNMGGYRCNTAEYYSGEGTHHGLKDLKYYCSGMGVTSNSGTVLFGGGTGYPIYGSFFTLSLVEAYHIYEDPEAHIHVVSGGVYNFGNGEITVPGTLLDAITTVVNVARPVNGYIKYKGEKYSG